MIFVLSKKFGKNIIGANYEITQLQGGTVGNVQLVSGISEDDNGEKVPYKIVLKIQNKWERPGDPASWRREYDLYMSDLESLFSDDLRWAKCYHAEMNEDKTQTQLWLEYIDGVSGGDLSIEMLEKAAFQLGRFQGRLYKDKSGILNNISCLSEVDAVKKYYMICREEMFNRINSLRRQIPDHLRKLITDKDSEAEKIFTDIERLPIVFCHRDFWLENIIYSDGKIRLIDWDTTGWGFMGEDVMQLIFDETDVECWEEYCRRFLPSYFRGISEYIDISQIDTSCIWEMIVLKYGEICIYYMASGSASPDEKKRAINGLQKIYEFMQAKGLNKK